MVKKIQTKGSLSNNLPLGVRKFGPLRIVGNIIYGLKNPMVYFVIITRDAFFLVKLFSSVLELQNLLFIDCISWLGL